MPQSFGWILAKQSKRVEILGLKSEKIQSILESKCQVLEKVLDVFFIPSTVLLHTSPPTPFGWKLTRAYFKKEEKLSLN